MGVKTLFIDGFGGQNPPSIDLKNLKKFNHLSLERSAFFHTEFAETAVMFFLFYPIFMLILRNFHRDAIIPVVKLF